MIKSLVDAIATRMPRIAVALGLALALGATSRVEAAVELLHYETLEIRAPTAGAQRRAARGAARELGFAAFGREFAVDLERNARLAGVARRLAAGSELTGYRGRLREADGSWVRLVRSDVGWSGLIWDGAELIGVETRADSEGASRTIAYRLADVYVTPGTLGCGSASASTDGAIEFAALVDELTPLAAAGADVNLDLGAVADSDFADAHGANTQAALLTRFNNVDGIFSEQLGIQVTVGAIDIMQAGSDPFTETDSEALLEQVADFRRTDPEQRSQGLTHLFTGKNLNGSTVGIAYVSAVCSANFGAGLSEGRRGSVLDSLVAAHEIGHNFGAPHDNESGSECESTPPTFLMAPSITGTEEFSACSIEQMQDEIASAQCLAPIPLADLATSAVDENVEIGTGESLDYAIAVANVGSEAAMGITLDISVDAALTVTDATSATGICTVLAGEVDCVLDDIGPGAETIVTLALEAGAPGTHAISALASATSDADPANDVLNDTIEVVPAADLSLTGATALALEVDEVFQSSVTLTNLSDLQASAIVVSVALPAGVSVDAATLAAAACDVTAGAFSCDLAALGAQASTELALDLRGEATGNHVVTVEAEAAEADPNPATNMLSLTVSVTAPAAAAPPDPQGQSSGGGGAAGLLWLGLLALSGFRRRPA
jgi:hypothetical protein